MRCLLWPCILWLCSLAAVLTVAVRATAGALLSALLMLRLAQRNGVDLPYTSVDEIRAAYAFTKLDDFLAVYYQGM